MGMEYFSQPSAESGAGLSYLSLYSIVAPFCRSAQHAVLFAGKMPCNRPDVGEGLVNMTIIPQTGRDFDGKM
jgi:hypothetical protein